MARRPFVVLDRDGTVIVERHYLSDPEQVDLIPGVGASLRTLSQLGLGLLIATNQSGIGRGYFDEKQLEQVHQRLGDLLAKDGVHLDGIYYCPHLPAEGCHCRKPETGMLEQAAQEIGVDPATSFVIGDNRADIELGHRVGATTLLVRTGYGAEVASDPAVKPDYVTGDLAEAASVIQRLAV